jgi:hypothetical protein
MGYETKKKMSRIYVYPRFSTLGAFGFRGGGPGLGNLFFPYARALLLAKEHNYALINPSWATFKLGPFLRRERDARLYLKIFKPRGVSGLRKTFLLLTRRKVTEGPAAKGNVTPGSIVLTHGLGDYFKDIVHEREYISESFRDMLRLQDTARIRAFGALGIGVHVRMGDFGQHQRMPLSWYVAMIRKIRLVTGVEVPVAVASDGNDAELAELLRLPGVRRLNSNAVVDMFSLAQSRIILASNSTFSAWAAFLGHVPILWGRRDATFENIFTDGTFNEVLAAEDNLPSRLAEYLRRVFR